MKKSEFETICVAVATRTPTILWGDPGIGKTSVVYNIARELDLPCEVILGSLRDPSDFAGLPIVRQEDTVLAPPAWAKRLADRPGILFLDEINTAPPAVQAALLRVALEKIVGEISLHPDTVILAAANPPDLSAGGFELAPSLANRFLHIKVSPPSANELAAALIGGWPPVSMPKPRKERGENMAALMAAFLVARPHFEHAPPKPGDETMAWPSARSWTVACRLLTEAERLEVSEEAKFLLMAGAVGEGTAIEFFSYKKNLDLPDPEDLLRSPETFKLSPRGDINFVVLAGVVQAVLGNKTPDRLNAAWRIIAMAAEQGGGDVAVPHAKALMEGGSTPPIEYARALVPVLKATGVL